jgi:hypothetical protein
MPMGRGAESPVRVGVLTLAVTSLFTGVRFAVAARGNIAAFVVVGADHARRSRLPPGVPVLAHNGYDGQFYYRLALDPWAWNYRAFGIALDTVYRIDRIGYPALAWLVAGGQRPWVPVTLVLVNVAAMALLGGFGAALSQSAGRPALWGLIFAGYWGLLWSLSRDLTEVVTATGIVGGLLALRRGRPLLAAVALTVAVLSRESALVLVGALVLARVVGVAQERVGGSPSRWAGPDRWRWKGPSSFDLAWAVPILAVVSWQSVVYARVGDLPLTASGGANVGVPFVGFARGLVHYLQLFPSTASLLWFGELTVLVVVAAAAAACFREAKLLLHERLAWIGYGLLMISLAPGIWLGDVGFRSLDEFFLLSWLVILCAQRRVRWTAILVILAWCVVATELVLYI